jgi:pimeloyl-ACP methyl ester carboxylesterase
LKIGAWLLGIVVASLAALVGHANYLIARHEVDAIDTHAPGRYVTVEGRRQHFVTVGDLSADPTGAPIMLIHGFIVSGHTELMPWAAETLGTKRALLLPDLMGYGFSQRDAVPGEWSTPRSHARYLALLLDQLGVQQVDVVGHSFGGALAARFALDYPERVRRVVYLNPGLYLPKSNAEVVIEMPLGLGRALTYHFLGNGPAAFPARLCGDAGECLARKPARIEDSTETLRAMMYTNRHTNVLEELYAEIPRLNKPGLILWGENDYFLPRSVADRFARDSRSRLLVLPHASHLPWLEKPHEVAQRILEFLQPD